MHTDSGMTGISPSGFMPYMTVASLAMSDEPFLCLNYSSLPIRFVPYDLFLYGPYDTQLGVRFLR